MPSLHQKLLSLQPGEVTEITELPLRDFPVVPYEKSAGGPPLVFSDHPEYISAREGAVVRERLEPGIARLYVYHCNGVEGFVSKITAVIENLGRSPLRYRFQRYGFAGPDTAYALVAKKGLWDFLHSTPETNWRELPVGGAAPLDDAAEQTRVRYNELVHGFYEIEIDQPVQVTVLQTDPEASSVEASRRIGMHDILPPRTPSGAGRGLYPTSDYAIRVPSEFVLDSSRGPRQLIVADGKIDPWLRGFDSSTGKECVEEGNYGVFYDIEIPYTTPDGCHWAVMTWNARSRDQWCEHMINVIEVNEGIHKGGFVEIPSDRLSLTGVLDVSLIQIFPPVSEGKTGTIRIRYTPPGASCLPTPILFIPVKAE